MSDPFWELVAWIVTIALGVWIPLLVTKLMRGRQNPEVTDYVKAFEQDQTNPREPAAFAPEKVDGVLLVPDASVVETAEICERLEKQ